MPSTVGRGEGGGRQVDDAVEQQPHAEVRERRPEEDRRRLALLEPDAVEVVADGVEQVQLVGCVLAVGARVGDGGDVEVLLARRSGAAGDPGEPCVGAVPAVDEADEGLARPDRPGDRRRREPQLRLDLVEQLERRAAGPVPLVDEGQRAARRGRGTPRTACASGARCPWRRRGPSRRRRRRRARGRCPRRSRGGRACRAGSARGPGTGTGAPSR